MNASSTEAGSQPVRYRTVLGRSFLLTAALWLMLSWPLPKMVFEVIPAGTVHPTGEHTVQFMLPGDHLQLLYHFWMMKDVLEGQTPWLYNVFEFNAGNDADRFEATAYYMPFSLFYAVGAWLVNDAFGWNLASFMSFWLGTFFIWLLSLRYNPSQIVAAIASALALSLPYRWHTLLGGSPTGFAMMWVPALLLGLDYAVRDARVRGGILASLVILVTGWGDIQVFYFSVLIIPCWCLFALMVALPFEEGFWKGILRRIPPLLPLPFFMAAGYWCCKIMTTVIGVSKQSSGRKMSEVALFSPWQIGIYSWEELGISNHVFIGYSLSALLVIILLAAIFNARKPEHRRSLGLLALLITGIAVVVSLSLGPNGYFEGRVFNAARDYLPSYDMIRQPAKVFCLMPSILAVAIAIGYRPFTSRKGLLALGIALAVPVLLEFDLQFRPLLCRLADSQEAYRAVSADAEKKGITPRALILPIWPGDSHYTSVYQFHVKEHRIRMMNGYRPFIPAHYEEEVFARFESGNLGCLDDDQINALRERGVGYVILHTDLFPEKVSPFPVTQTLRSLLNHPRLFLVEASEAVWAFEILDKPILRTPQGTTWSHIFSTRHIETERQSQTGTETIDDPAASNGAFQRMASPGSGGQTRHIPSASAPDLRWMARVRGSGVVTWFYAVDEFSTTNDVPIDAKDWTWLPIRGPAFESSAALTLGWRLKSGVVDLDTVFIAAGPDLALEPGQIIHLASPSFFHSGHINLSTDTVSFDPVRNHRGIVWYGPKLPLHPGAYRLSVALSTTADDGTVLGRLIVACPEGREVARTDVVAGKPTGLSFTIDTNLPILFTIENDGTGTMEVGAVTLSRDATGTP